MNKGQHQHDFMYEYIYNVPYSKKLKHVVPTGTANRKKISVNRYGRVSYHTLSTMVILYRNEVRYNVCLISTEDYFMAEGGEPSKSD